MPGEGVRVLEQEDGHRHWSDEPLAVDGIDSFGRQPFISTLVQRIQLASATDPSTVFGLVGAWGSGKTSVLNRVRAGLPDDWTIVDFTPWSSGDSASMSLEFVRTLAEALGNGLDKDMRRRLAGYATYVAPLLGAVPIFGGGLRATADHVLAEIGRRAPWHRQFKELSARIQSLGKRVLIVVDDVDRLGADELLTLLRVLRLLGRFRGVHYLIAYDQDTVEDLLRSTGAVGRSTAFMEKIVQYPFETPPLPRAATLRLTDAAVGDLLSATGRQLDEVGLQRASSLMETIAAQIQTPRTLGRFREHLLAFSSHVNDGQLDVVDFVAVTWLRLASHGVWAELGRSFDVLRSGSRVRGILDREEMTPSDWEAFVVRADTAADVQGTLAVLAIMFQGVHFPGISDYLDHERSISDPTYFGRYLILAIPEDDVSDELIEDVVRGHCSNLDARMTELAVIIDGNDDALARLALSRYRSVREKYKEPSGRLLDFVFARLQTRVSDIDQVGALLTDVRQILAAEAARGLVAGVVSVSAVIDLVGEDESLNLVWLTSRTVEFRDRKKEIAHRFAAYWHPQLLDRFDELRERRLLARVCELLVFCYSAEELAGTLDSTVVDYEDFVSLGIGFVHLAEWVGSSVSYELNFRSKQFAALVSVDVRDQYRSQIEAEAGQVAYDTDDYPSRDIPPAVIRAFAIDSLRSLYISVTEVE